MTTPTNNPEPHSVVGQRTAVSDGIPELLTGRSRTVSRASYFDSTMRLLPGIHLPLRSMLAIGEKRQLLVSPVATAEEASQVLSAGKSASEVVLIAPSLLHHLFFQTAIERYRPVALWGPPSFAEHHRKLGPVYTFGVDAWPYDDELAFCVIDGAPRRNEVVFLHRASRTIYTADLFFNMRHPHGLLAPLAMRLMGVYQRFGAPRMWKHWVTDRAAFTRSIDHILSWDFDRIVMAHGDPIEDRGRERFERALRELNLLD